MTDVASARSLLFVPGTRPERFAKAAGSGADAIVCDLEDAVAPDDKPRARDLLVEEISRTPAMVRINAAGTPWHDDDLAAVTASRHVRGVMLPKAEDPEVVAALAARLGATALVLLVESALGIEAASALARVPGVTRLAFGTLDYAIDVGLTVRTDDEDELLYARSRLVVASRAGGLPGPIDGVTPQIDDEDLLRRRTSRGRDLGLTGALCIHPKQVAVIHDAFAPTEAEIAWARRVIAAAGDSHGAAVRMDGQMVDRPVLVRAESILARAES